MVTCEGEKQDRSFEETKDQKPRCWNLPGLPMQAIFRKKQTLSTILQSKVVYYLQDPVTDVGFVPMQKKALNPWLQLCFWT